MTPLSVIIRLPAGAVPSVQLRTRFRCLRRLQPTTLDVCACLCASHTPSPSTAPVQGLLEPAAPGKQWVVMSCLVRLPSRLTLITRRGNRQTTNVSTCKFAETRLTVKRQCYLCWQCYLRYPIID